MDNLIGIDLGGTNVRAGLITGMELVNLQTTRVNSKGTMEQVLDQLFEVTDGLNFDLKQAKGIGVGVPSVVDTEKGIVYDVQNIPSWLEVPIKSILEEKYQVPVSVNNDANCHTLAEYHFGKGQGSNSMVGLIIGTGVAGGIIVNGKLFEGATCGAGEFGMVPYLDSCYEKYCAGLFFKIKYGLDGGDVAKKAQAGDHESLEIMKELGTHIGQLISTILYTYDPQVIVLGGSVSKSYPLFQPAVWEVLNDFAYSPTVKKLKIEVSELENPGVFGAAALLMK